MPITVPSTGGGTSVAQSVTDGVTDSAPSQDAVFDALDAIPELAQGDGITLTPGVGITTVAVTPGVYAPAVEVVAPGATTGAVDLDLSTMDNKVVAFTATGNVDLTLSNKVAGRQVSVAIEAGASNRTLTYEGWDVVGPALPTTLLAGKVLLASFVCRDTTTAGVLAAGAVQL